MAKRRRASRPDAGAPAFAREPVPKAPGAPARRPRGRADEEGMESRFMSDLKRLRRSVDKLLANNPQAAVSAQGWTTMLDAYRAAVA